MNKHKQDHLTAPIDRISDWPTLFEQVRKNPLIFTGEKSARLLQYLLIGIHIAESIHHIPSDQLMSGFDWNQFEEWVRSRNNPENLNVSSFMLASMNSENEEAAFDKWMEWYDIFREDQNA